MNAHAGIDQASAEEAAALSAALGQHGRAARAFASSNRPAIGRLLQGEFEISSFAEAEKLATMLAMHCPDPESASIGIWELICNAIEHGNLEIDFDTKTRLILAGDYQDELGRRALDPRYLGRMVRVKFRQLAREVRLRIADEGPGFDFEAFERLPADDARPNGRGIALARRFTFDEVTFRGCGNVVEAVIRRKP